MSPWLLLAAAIASELAGTASLKLSVGFTRLWPSLAVVVGYGLSFWLLSQTLKRMDISVAYAVWSGVGTASMALIGWAVFAESMTPPKIASIALIVVGVVGLNLTGSTR